MIQAINLTKKFGRNVALNSINLDIKPGCIYGLVGSNGSGKSTFLRIASGVYDIDAGQILIDGKNPYNNPETKANILFLPDNPFFLMNSNLETMAGFYKKMYPAFDMGRYNNLLSVFPLDRKAQIRTMSKGMQRQAALILALSCKPKYLYLDEAFDGLDPVMRSVLKQLLLDGIMTDELTVLISSHNLRELEDLCDHLILIHNGNVLYNNSLDFLSDNVQKVQIIFPEGTEPNYNDFDILKHESTGSLHRLIIKGDKAEVEEKLKSYSPVFFESVSPSIEEFFIYELGVSGYDVQNILK